MKPIKIRLSTPGKMIKLAFNGFVFAMINEISNYLIPAEKIKKIKIDPDKALAEVEIDINKLDYFAKIGNEFIENAKENKNGSFNKCFLFGSFGLFLERRLIDRFVRLFHISKYKMLLAISTMPLNILMYYGFCGYYDGMSFLELKQKLAKEIFPLISLRFVQTMMVAQIITKLSKTRTRSFPFSLLFLNYIWIFVLVSIYEERIKFNKIK